MALSHLTHWLRILKGFEVKHSFSYENNILMGDL